MNEKQVEVQYNAKESVPIPVLNGCTGTPESILVGKIQHRLQECCSLLEALKVYLAAERRKE